MVCAVFKMIKPNKEIYQLLLGKLNCHASKVLFLDDRIENVEAAKNQGINSWQFTSAVEFGELNKNLKANDYDHSFI